MKEKMLWILLAIVVSYPYCFMVSELFKMITDANHDVAVECVKQLKEFKEAK